MSTNVYNIVWADDEIDDILDKDTIDELKGKGFNIVGMAHDGEELEALLDNPEQVDAVIVDANFNESDGVIENERDTSGLDYARGLYIHKLKRRIPFFLFTNRSDELLMGIYQDNPKFLDDFPRHKRWFKKSSLKEYNDMLGEIKKVVDESKSPSFTVRNKYKYELNAARLIDGAEELIFEILTRDIDNSLEGIKEPFARMRKIIERLFCKCEILKLIPPISNNTNGTAYYFLNNECHIKDRTGKITSTYKMVGKRDIMHKVIATGLKYIVDITQDGSHSKKELKLKVDEYFEQTKDTLLLKSVAFILIDVIKWFALTALEYRDVDYNENTLWRKCE